MNAYWRAANDLFVGQIDLKDNPLIRSAPTRKVIHEWLPCPYWF
jgi:phosphoketolase